MSITNEEALSYSNKMKRHIIHIFTVLVIIYLYEVKCAKVVKSGIEQLSLNAKRESRLWTAIGSNGTQGIQNRITV